MSPVHDKALISGMQCIPHIQTCLGVLINTKAFPGTGGIGTLETDACVLPSPGKEETWVQCLNTKGLESEKTALGCGL